MKDSLWKVQIKEDFYAGCLLLQLHAIYLQNALSAILLNVMDLMGVQNAFNKAYQKKTKKGGTVHVYPFDERDLKGPVRAKEYMQACAKRSITTGMNTFGVKGLSYLSLLGSYCPVDSMGIDYMHGVLLGVMKLLLKLWFSSENSSEVFSHTKQVKEVDKRSLSIKPPDDITRRPRSTEHHIKYWKASELRSLMLYYGPIVLKGVLENELYEHFFAFK